MDFIQYQTESTEINYSISTAYALDQFIKNCSGYLMVWFYKS